MVKESFGKDRDLPVAEPDYPETAMFSDAQKAVARLNEIYDCSTAFLRDALDDIIKSGRPATKRYRAYYPQIRITTTSYTDIDSRLAFGHVAAPGTYAATITRPDLFENYLQEQIALIIANHEVEVSVGISKMALPIHFALGEGAYLEGPMQDILRRPLRDVFDAPDLASTDDNIVNGELEEISPGIKPLSLFSAPRIDYSLHRLAHYTATSPEHFQNYVLFTNYQFYIDEFIRFAGEELKKKTSPYEAFVEPGNVITKAKGKKSGNSPARLPQMPAYHLKTKDRGGITMVNIGVGPSNAKTITDHIAVLRPHAWIMLGHCAGLRNTQSLGDYVLAHAYMREDHVLDDDLPVWVPIPALAEIQVALQEAVAEITGLSGYELKRVMRTGTVGTIDNRNWELRDQSGPVRRLSLARAIALDMESATIAANGYRFRVPYGTLLCISDKPLHGELKLPGMATEFYNRQVAQHLLIGIRAMEKLREMPDERLHSRKLRSFDETAFQ